MTGVVPIREYYNPSLVVSIGPLRAEFEDGRGFAMKFKVGRSTSSKVPDAAEVQIVGLSTEEQRVASEAFSRAPPGAIPMTIEAGYGKAKARLFRGDIRAFATNLRKGPDEYLRAVGDDGGEALTKVPLQVSNAAMTVTQMVEIAALAMKLTLHPSTVAVLAAATPAQQSPFTSIVTRRASHLLDAACRRMRCRWWMRDGQLFMSKRRGLVDKARPAVAITSDMKVSDLSPRGGGLFQQGVLFDPNLVPGSQIFVEGRFLRIESVVHSGVTRGGEVWTSNLIARTLDA